MTHDLFVSFAHAFGVRLVDVFIYKFEDGIFSSQLTFTDGERTIAIDSRTSDAIAIAMRTHTPIYTTPAILDETGFIMEQTDEDNDRHDDDNSKDTELPAERNSFLEGPPIEKFSIEQLEEELERLIAVEDYEKAARVNEILRHKRGEI